MKLILGIYQSPKICKALNVVLVKFFWSKRSRFQRNGKESRELW